MYKASLKTVFLINILTHCVADEALAITPADVFWEGASTAGLRSGHLSPWETLQKQEFNTQNTPKNCLISIKTFARKFYESFFSLDLDTFDFK